VILGLSVAFYATDSIHGISPAWVTLGAGILCLLPPWGMLTPRMVSEKTNLFTLIYVAGILGLGAVVADSGLGEVVSDRLLHVIRLVPGETALNAAVLTVIGMILTLLATATGLPAVLTPLAGEFAAATGLPILTVLMLQVVSFSTVLLPYVSPPMMVWLQMSGVEIRAASKLCLAIGAITIVVLLPIDYVWWRLLGYFP
jgi:di/tricarboxylate transporter